MFEQRLFIEALRFVSHCAAIKDVRYYLNGVHFELSPTRLTIVATDGNRMAMAEIVGSFGDAAGAITIKGSDIKFILSAIKAVKGEVVIGVGADTFSIEATGVQRLNFQALDGRFPDWRRVMPQGEPEATTAFCVNSVYLAEAAKACDRLSGKYSGAKIELRGPTRSMWVQPDILTEFAEDGLERAGVVVMPMRL